MDFVGKLKLPVFTTAERDAITTWEDGHAIYNSTVGGEQVFGTGVWTTLGSSGGGSAVGQRYYVQFRGQTGGTFDASAKFQYDSSRESLTVGVAGTNLSNNPCSINSDVNDFSQSNVQNVNAGSSASSDIVATANNGNDNTNYVDLGINSSTYNDPTFYITGANDSYLYSAGGNLAIGTADVNEDLIFFTGGTTTTNEVARAKANGNFILRAVALALNTVTGFSYIRSLAGIPTGTPTAYTGNAPIVVDGTNNALYFYSSGAWRTVVTKYNNHFNDESSRNANSTTYLTLTSLSLTGLVIGRSYLISVSMEGNNNTAANKSTARATIVGGAEIFEHTFNANISNAWATASANIKLTATATTHTVLFEGRGSTNSGASFRRLRINLNEI